MKRLLAIALHPITYFRLKRMQEWIVLLWASAKFLDIEKPSVWDVDRVHEIINQVYGAFHEYSNILNITPTVKKKLFWTIFLSKFKTLEITREEAKRVLDFYNNTCVYISYLIGRGEVSYQKADLYAVVCHMNLAVQMFWCYI